MDLTWVGYAVRTFIESGEMIRNSTHCVPYPISKKTSYRLSTASRQAIIVWRVIKKVIAIG